MVCDYPVSQLRIVKVQFRDMAYYQTHYLHESQVDMFVKATVRLYHDKSYRPTASKDLWQIMTITLSEPESYWWTSLELDGSEPNAKIHNTNSSKRLWAHPELLAEDYRCEAME